jgi:TRAP-type C4-dicarboxylate transport system permease small subunit
MKRPASALASAERVLGRAAAVLLVLLLVLINVEVVARYAFNRSTLIADEYGGYLMAWITMLGAVHLLRADRHLTMSLFVDKLSPRARNAAGVIAAILGLCISAILLYATSLLVISSARFGSVSIQPSATPLVWPQLILPIGYALLCVAYVDEIVHRVVAGVPSGREDDIGSGMQ